MAAKNMKTKPNILNVSLRLLLIAAFLGSAYALYSLSGTEKPGTVSLIGIGLLLLCAAVTLIQLIVWGLIWVKHERVSELGLHIVRYAVTLTAISLCVFVLLSLDYGKLYSATHMNELRQNVISASVYIQPAVGESIEDDTQYFIQLQQAMEDLLLDTEENSNRHACLYLKTESQATGNSGFAAVDGGYIGLSTNETVPCSAEAALLDSVMSRFSVEYIENAAVGTYTLTSAYSPVFSVNGEPVGVLEICEISQAGAGIFRFANLELCLKLLALVAFFSFMFYGCMQLVDIVLRPRQFDRSRRVLSCGRESARPILFFIALSAALPVMMLLFADNLRELMNVYNLPFGIGTYIPFIAYLLGIMIGQLFGRGHRETLSEIPADAGLLFSFLCNLALCLFMDWKVLRGLGLADNVIFVLVLVFVCGLGYGIAYRITAKFQAQSDALFGYDKYVYLCSCLGAIAGIVLGALIIENYSNVTLRVVSCILTAFTAVIAILLLEDLKSTVEIDESCKDTLTSYAGGIAGIVPVGLACCFNWIYLAEYMFENSISTAAIGFCTVMPIVAFCFGNRLRLKHRAAQRGTLVVSGVLSALSFVPMAFMPSFDMAVVSCLVICIAVIFAASGIYSTTRHGELKKLTFRAMPLLFIGIIAAVLALNLGDSMINLLVGAGVCVIFMIIFLVSKYPSRPIIESNLPAITSGAHEVKKSAAIIPPTEEKNEPVKTDKKQKTDKRRAMDKEPDAVVIPAPSPEEKTAEPEKKDDAEEIPEKEPVKQEVKPAEEAVPVQKAPAEQPVEEPVEASKPEQKTEESKAEPEKEPAASVKQDTEEQPEEEPMPIIIIDDAQSEPDDKAEEIKPQTETAAPVQTDAAPEISEVSGSSDAPAAEAVPDEPEDDEAAAAALALAREAAARRAKERWQQYNEMASKADSDS